MLGLKLIMGIVHGKSVTFSIIVLGHDFYIQDLWEYLLNLMSLQFSETFRR